MNAEPLSYPVVVRLPRATLSALDRLAEQHQVPRSRVVRALLGAQLREVARPAPLSPEHREVY